MEFVRTETAVLFLQFVDEPITRRTLVHPHQPITPRRHSGGKVDGLPTWVTPFVANGAVIDTAFTLGLRAERTAPLRQSLGAWTSESVE